MARADYSPGQLFSLDACTNCGICAEICPAVEASGDGNLSGVLRLKKLKQLLRRRRGLAAWYWGRPTERELKEFSDTVFKCTLCGNCEQVCPVGLGLKGLWLSLRQDLHGSETYPPKIDLIENNLESSHNVFDEENEERAEWVEDMEEEPDDGLIRDSAEVVYFTGCVAAFYPMAQEIPVALAEVLEAAEVNFTLLGEEEWCCGFPLLGAGLKEKAGALIEHNLAAVRAKGADKVVFACPSCYQMWREHYPTEGLELFHATQFLDKLLSEGRLPLVEKPLKVTYHDPCDLGRGAGEYEAPRRILRAIPGVEFVELPRNRENCRCCGGGGNLEMIDAELSAKISQAKIEEIMSTGAEAVISSCQQCLRTMATHVRRNKVPLKVMDITQLIRSRLDD